MTDTGPQPSLERSALTSSATCSAIPDGAGGAGAGGSGFGAGAAELGAGGGVVLFFGFGLGFGFFEGLGDSEALGDL
ncbi:hypothetical protein G3M53_07295, partial [Streptomyces sp. SID7982]|nr:hypothetical protein [Streptomyces sp. SID7982]